KWCSTWSIASSFRLCGSSLSGDWRRSQSTLGRLLRLQPLQVRDGRVIFPKRLRAPIARGRKLLLCRRKILEPELNDCAVIVSLAGLIRILGRGQSCRWRGPTDEQFADGFGPILEFVFAKCIGQGCGCVGGSRAGPGHGSPNHVVTVRIGKP